MINTTEILNTYRRSHSSHTYRCKHTSKLIVCDNSIVNENEDMHCRQT